VAKSDAPAPRPRRTREHVIASQSRNYIEMFFIDKGHVANRENEDYGYDLVVRTFDADGFEESGEILLQLKASDRVAELKRGNSLFVEISRKHFELWTAEPMPIFLLMYDAHERKAYWLYVQAYFAAHRKRMPKRHAKTLTVEIPLANEFTEKTVEYAQARKAVIVSQSKTRVYHDG
jgi:hypothetical protein